MAQMYDPHAQDTTGTKLTPCATILVMLCAVSTRTWADDAVTITTFSAGTGEEYFGTEIESGDFNGDGTSDLLIASGILGGGKVYEYNGSSSGYATTPTTTLTGCDSYGYGLSAGDTDHDGFDDLAATCSKYSGGYYYEFSIDMFYGSILGLATPGATLENPASVTLNVAYGAHLSMDGDMNDDGFTELLVGAPSRNTDVEDPTDGYVFIYQGSAAGVESTWDAYLPCNNYWHAEGCKVAFAGDVNGDGRDDVLVSPVEGAVEVYLSALTGETTPDQYLGGSSMTSAGDVNGDGYADILVGNRYGDTEGIGGQAYIFIGSSAGVESEPSTVLQGEQPDDEFGFSVASVGDVDDDGFSDIFVGAIGYGDTYSGGAFVYWGSSSGYSDDAKLELTGSSDDIYFGAVVLGLGAASGGESKAVAVSAPSNGDAGRVYVFSSEGDDDGDGYNGFRDCDDSNVAVNAGATEICDGIDNDCDGLVDDADPSVTGAATWYSDGDGDGYGCPAVAVTACAQPAGHTADNTDCNDADSSVHPGAVDTPGDGIDQDCDGVDASSPEDTGGMDTGATTGDSDTGHSKKDGCNGCNTGGSGSPAGYFFSVSTLLLVLFSRRRLDSRTYSDTRRSVLWRMDLLLEPLDPDGGEASR